MQEREELIDELFDAVCDLDAASRAEFFAARRRSLDDSLLTQGVLDEVSSLLDANDAALESGFLQQSFFREDEENRHGDALIHQSLDGYTILNLIAEGGMGEVYRARDEELDFDVAIKIVRGGGFGRRDLIRRFHAERRILAGLKHPNIAQVFKSGATADNLPYLVMEYVDGHSIAVYADEHKLDTRARLELFRKVCAAVAYAHQHLVIHRDIKPSNVLVTPEGERKLLDFGIAKLLDATHATDATLTGLRAMTPEYASPEQIKGETVTTATDVYSLGVLLYELLSGRHPYREKFQSAGALEQAVCTIEPQRPSAFVKRTKHSPESEAQHGTKHSAPDTDEETRAAKTRARELRGDLDNIVLMALRKEPERRYVSIGQFSEDIRRYLAGLPVAAHKDTFRYRAQKFVRRNKIGVGAAALVALALVTGTIVATWQAHVARKERARTERVFKDVRQLANSLVFEVHEAIRDLPGATRARELLVRHAGEYLDRVAQEAGSDAALQSELATAYLKIGDVQGMPYAANLGDTAGAIRSYGKAVAMLEAVIALAPKDVDARQQLSSTYQRLGAAQSLSGDWKAGLENQRRAMGMCEALLKHDPANVGYKILLGQSYSYLGDALSSVAEVDWSIEDARQALESYRQSLAVRDELFTAAPGVRQRRGELMQGYERVGFGYLRLGTIGGETENFRQALGSFRQSQEHREALFASNSSNALIRRILADGEMNLGLAQHLLHDDAGALESYRQALPIFEALAASDPHNLDAQRDLFYLHTNTAIALAGMKDARGALAQSREALILQERLHSLDPQNVEDRAHLLSLYDAIGDVLRASGDTSGALDNYRKGLMMLEAWRAAEPESRQAIYLSAKEFANVGSVYEKRATDSRTRDARQAEEWREASSSYERSAILWQTLRDQRGLFPIETDKFNEATREFSKCNAALGQLHNR